RRKLSSAALTTRNPLADCQTSSPDHNEYDGRSRMSRKLNRRTFLTGTVAGTAAATLHFPAPAVAQGAPFKIGLLTVKTGPLAQGGIQMEQGIATLLKGKDST